MLKQLLIIFISLCCVLGTTSCKLFKKTKKCDTCPTWKAKVETLNIKKLKV